jgi:hypothetical protein
VRDDLSNAIQTSLTFWVAHPSTQPPSAHIINLEVRNAMKEQAKIGWGNFFKGMIAIKIQHLINERREGPLNQFEQIRWTCEVIAITWESQRDHWTHRNNDKHGHTPEEESKIKRDILLKKAHELFVLKSQIDPKYRTKIYPSWNRIKLKRTCNLEVWIATTKQTIHYLLEVNKQADDDPQLSNQDPVPPLFHPNPD